MNERTAMLIGDDGADTLAGTHIAVFGLGGVGGYATEALARSGIGRLTIIDSDVYEPGNLNRQIGALSTTLGRQKTMVMRERITTINPGCEVTEISEFFGAENADTILAPGFDYVIDAIDTVSSKLELIAGCLNRAIPIVSSMGTGNRLDPSRLLVSDIADTSVCPLARVMRRELKARGITGIDVVWSDEPPVATPPARNAAGKSPVGSMVFVPAAAGMLLASHVVRRILGLG